MRRDEGCRQLFVGVAEVRPARARSSSLGLSATTALNSVSPFSSQNRMSISLYIAVAVVRCSCACSLRPVFRANAPKPRWQWATRGRMPSSTASVLLAELVARRVHRPALRTNRGELCSALGTEFGVGWRLVLAPGTLHPDNSGRWILEVRRA